MESESLLAFKGIKILVSIVKKLVIFIENVLVFSLSFLFEKLYVIIPLCSGEKSVNIGENSNISF